MQYLPSVDIINNFKQDNFNQSYYLHYDWIYRWISKKLGSTQDAADLTQDTFLRVIQKKPNEKIQEPRAYLCVVAHHVMVNHIRRRDIEQAYLNALAFLEPSHTPSAETQMLIIDSLYEIDAMLHTLPINVRKAYLMLQLDGYSYAQIAAELKVSTRTVTSYIAKATLHCALYK